MSNIQRIRLYLFVLSLFFTLPANIVGEQSIVEVDWSNNKVAFQFHDLGIPEAEKAEARAVLTAIDTTPSKLSKQPGVRMDTFYLYEEDKKLNAHLSFYLDHSDNIRQLLMMDMRDSIQSYKLLEAEKLISTNGKVNNSGNATTVTWPISADYTTITTRAQQFRKDPSFNKTTSLLPYWQELQAEK